MRIVIFWLLCLFFSTAYGQEICDNGIDDDGDGLIDLNDNDDCNCVIKDYITDPYFADTTRCPVGDPKHQPAHFTAIRDWKRSGLSPEFYHPCETGDPSPTGGSMLMLANNNNPGDPPGNFEYAKNCLAQPLLAGVTYTFEFTAKTDKYPTDFILIGNDDCSKITFGPRCIPDMVWFNPINLEWDVLATVAATGIANQYNTYSVNFTPTRDIPVVSIGAGCNTTKRTTIFFDYANIFLDSDSPEITSISKTGNTCTGDLVLTTTVDPVGGNWQWYKEGVALTGETNTNIDISAGGYGLGNYTARYTFNGNCDTSTFNVIKQSTDTAEFSYADTSYCLNSMNPNPTPTITATTGGEFTITAPGIIDVASGVVDIAGSGLGNFTVSYRTTTDPICPDTATFELEIIACIPPTANYNVGDTVICIGECVDFNDLSTGATSWEWNFNGGNPNTMSNSGPHNVCFNSAGVYDIDLIAENRFGSDTTRSVLEVIVKDDASFNYSSALICDSISSTLPVGIVTLNGTFSIDNGGSIINTSGEINPSTMGSGNYVVTHTTTGPCPDTATFNIEIVSCIPPTASYSVSDSTICEGDCIDFTDLSSGATAWEWTFNGGTPNMASSIGPHRVCFNSGGTYNIELTVTNQYGSDIKSSMVAVSNIPTIDTKNDLIINLGESTTLTTTSSVDNYTWSPPTWLDCPTCLSPEATPAETITYEVTAVDSNGCVATDNITIIVDFDLAIFIPNIFSPNGDGHNDILYVRGAGIASLNFIVYNRWGEKVFGTQNLDTGWDGTFRGKKMNNAVFSYYLEATFIDGTKAERKGDVTLIK